MSLSPYFVFSRKFREEIGRTGGFEPPADFFNKHEAEVKKFSTSVCGDRVPLMPGASHDKIQTFWSGRADRIMIKRALQTPTAVRPPSPTFVPTDQNEKKIAPKTPLQPEPKHKSKLLFKQHAVNDQITIYRDAEEMRKKGKDHIRVGKPAYMATHDSSLSMVGKKSLFDVYGIFAQYSLYRNAFKDNFPAATLADVELGLRTAREAADFRSKLFRGDLLVYSQGPMSRQDRLIGFSGAETTMKHTEQSVRYNQKTGKKEYYNRPFRLPEFILTASRFDLIFPTFEQRETVRRLLGASSGTFPSNMSLLSPEEYADLTRLWSVLPKMRRKAFTIVLYHEGLAIGSLLFAGQTRTLTLKPGETVLSLEDFYCEPTNNFLNRGPLASNVTLQYDCDKKKAQLQSQEAVRKEKDTKMLKLQEQFQQANYFNDALADGGRIEEQAHRESMRQLFNHQLAEVMSCLSQEDQRLTQLIRERVPSLQGVPDFSKIVVDQDKPSEPGFIHIDAEGMKIKLPVHELQQYFTIDFKAEFISSLKKREEAIRARLESLGFVPSFSREYQHFMLRVKSTRNFLNCSKCFNKPPPKICMCLTEYWAAILENGPIEWDDFGPCGYCCFAKCYEKICKCQHDHVLGLSAELKRLQKLGQGMPCPRCFGPEDDCRCQRYGDGAEQFENAGQIGDLYGDTVHAAGNSTPGNISEAVNPDFSTPDTITAEDAAYLSRPEPTGILTFAELEQLTNNKDKANTVQADTQQKDLDQTFIPGEHFTSPDRPRMKMRGDGSKLCSKRGWGVPTVGQREGESAALASSSTADEPGSSTLVVTERSDFQEGVSVEDVLNFSAAAQQYLEKSERPVYNDLMSHTQEEDTAQRLISDSQAGGPSILECTEQTGIAIIPADVILVNGHIEGDNSRPEYIRDDGEKTNVLPVLFQPPYTAGVSSEWLNTCADIEVIKRRYTKKREDGHSYCPLDTFTKILRDVSRSRLPKPAEEKSLKELEKLFGKKTAARVAEAREKKEQLLVVRATSYHMEEPTDIPDCAHRPWTFRLTDLESHQASPLSVYIQYLGQISYTSQSWEEYLDSQGRQYLRSTFPGKPSGTFIMSSGGRRSSAERQLWPVKLSGRVLTCLLVGGGIHLTPEEFAAQGFTEEMCLDPSEFSEEPPFTEVESSVGSRPGAVTIPETYEPPSRVGRWEKIQKEGGEIIYQKLYWAGMGYHFHMQGYEEENGGSGHRIIFTRDGDVPSEILQAEYGIGYWLSEQRAGIQARYKARCKSRGTQCRSEVFTCPFAHGSLSVFWADLVPLVARVMGSKWREYLEDLIFSICDDQNIVYRHGTREETASNGRYNASEEFPYARDSEMLARVDMDGRVIYLPEERSELNQAQLYDYGYKFSAITAASRSPRSTKLYTSLETAAKETL